MGWSYTQGQTRAGLIQELVNRRDGGKTLKHTARGNTLWVVQETPTGERFIAAFLLQGDRNYGWGYKGISEDMGPYHYDCPLSFFDLVPEPPNDYARKWREDVRKYHADRRKIAALKPGDTFQLLDGFTPKGPFTLDTVKPIRAIGPNGVRYKLTSTAIDADSINRDESDGTEGQDRESYSDTQDRDNYTVDDAE